MNKRIRRQRDSLALVFAAAGSLLWSFVNPPQLPTHAEVEQPAEADPALEGLLGAEAAQATGSWWLDDPAAEARLSYAPEHQRLVWRVGNTERKVLLDAETGEALGFEYQ